jgi:hypothetical protein
VTTGLISDALAPTYGINSLRYAMVIVGLVGTTAIPMFYMASRYLPGDLARGHGVSAQTGANRP